MRKEFSKAGSIAIITLIYGIAAAVGVLLFNKLQIPELAAILLADVLATIVVWGFGLLYKNVSVYDPYWSVAPPVIFTLWAIYKNIWTLPVILLLLAVWFWGIRLTGNWAGTFKGLAHEDWRYTRYRESQAPLLFHITNFFGLNLMPTLIVFLCMIPGLKLYDGSPATVLSWLGFAISITAATLQLISDTQIHTFRREHPGQHCNIGLWKHGRHPNYFGEISFWWGIWIMYGQIDWLILAPVAMTALFLFISIPMMERRQLQNKPGYAEYRKSTRILI